MARRKVRRPIRLGESVTDQERYDFCQKCGEMLIEKRMPMAEKALGEKTPPKQRWCPKCRKYRN